MLEGSLPVADLPEAWNANLEQRLNIRPANDVEGCLQDIHWAVGHFGYFPVLRPGRRHRRSTATKPCARHVRRSTRKSPPANSAA